MKKFMLELVTMVPGLYVTKYIGDVADFGNDDEAITFDSYESAVQFASHNLHRYPLKAVMCLDERCGKFCTQDRLLERIFIDDRVL